MTSVAASPELVPSATVSPAPVRMERILARPWLVIAGVWMVPALLAASETYLFWRLGGRSYPFWRAVVMEGPAWMIYALLTPLVFALGRRLPLQRPRLGRHLAAHLAVSLTAGLLYASVATLTTQLFTPIPRTMPFSRMVLSWFLSALPLTTLTYFGTLGAGLALAYFAEARRREVDASRLTAQLAEARLGALRMQLHPHFLFNTLNAVTVLARDGDSGAVARMLTLLSELLRDVLRSDGTHLVPLEEELSFSRRYLEIELVRFADRLRVREVVDPHAWSMHVPAFVLQPLIENALRHGIAPRGAGGTIEIGARLVDGGPELWVSDDGVGLPSDWSGTDDYGIGLSNTAARLDAMSGGAGSLEITRVASGGTRCVVRLPRR
ncbi:MAG TPA: histidine kinase [Gemmatimonadaceae bacterium]|nr:histidine kinase [Gemmatimonadaceae bacterium]